MSEQIYLHHRKHSIRLNKIKNRLYEIEIKSYVCHRAKGFAHTFGTGEYILGLHSHAGRDLRIRLPLAKSLAGCTSISIKKMCSPLLTACRLSFNDGATRASRYAPD